MAKFINETLGMVAEADLLQTGFNISRPNDPLEGLFAAQQTENLVAEYYTIASEYAIPQMAQFHAFDVQAQKSERAPINEQNVEKGLIKVKRNTSELLRQLMRRGVTVESQLYDFVMDDTATLADQVVTRAKVARAEALSTGQVTIDENGIDITIDFGVPASHKGLTIDVGNGASEDIISQFQAIVDNALDGGVTITGMICPRAFLTKLRKNSVLQKAINGNAQNGQLVRAGALNAFLAEEFGIDRIITDDLTYSLPWTMPEQSSTASNATERPQAHIQHYWPRSRVTFFGTYMGMRLGIDLWGVPPEVEIANFMQVNGSGQSPYVYVSQWAEKDPAVLWTKASALYIPALLSPQALFLADIADTPGA